MPIFNSLPRKHFTFNYLVYLIVFFFKVCQICYFLSFIYETNAQNCINFLRNLLFANAKVINILYYLVYVGNATSRQ